MRWHVVYIHRTCKPIFFVCTTNISLNLYFFLKLWKIKHIKKTLLFPWFVNSLVKVIIFDMRGVNFTANTYVGPKKKEVKRNDIVLLESSEEITLPWRLCKSIGNEITQSTNPKCQASRNAADVTKRVQELKKQTSECRTREFLRTRENCIEKHQSQPSASHTPQLFLKIPKCLYYSTMHEDMKFFISFAKC